MGWAAFVGFGLVLACVDTGDKSLTGKEIGERSQCATYCDRLEEAGCKTTSRCETDCRQEAVDCSREATQYYGCANEQVVRCAENGAPLVHAKCEVAFHGLADCLEQLQNGVIREEYDCAETNTESACQTCCDARYPNGWLATNEGAFACFCEPGICLEACVGYCTDESVLEQSTECEACWAERWADCEEAMREACSADPECSQLSKCLMDAACFSDE